jgi:nucleotide-binding universal stress UspA family protein
MMKVLIAIDGSDPARRAIEAASRLAKHGAAVDAVLVHVREAALAQARNSGLQLGSMAQRVVHLAAVPVTLVK